MNTQTPASFEKSIVTVFKATVKSNPNAIVAQTIDESLTLARLDQAVGMLSSKIDFNPSHDNIVGVYSYPGFDLLAGIWGVLFSGSAYCPLSPDYPEDRIRYMVEQSGMTTVACHSGLEEKLREVVGNDINIITPDFITDGSQTDFKTASLSSSDLAYVIFTSGSTGRPRGVMIEHGNIASQMDWFHSTFDLGFSTTILQKTPFSFDAAQWELLSSAFGATLIFGSSEGYRNPFEQIRLIKKFEVNMLQCVPTLWRALIETEQLDRCQTLTKIFSGGEALSRELARNCMDALPEADLINLYGPTVGSAYPNHNK